MQRLIQGFHLERARVGTDLELRHRVRLTVDTTGTIVDLAADVTPRTGDLVLAGTVVPGLVDPHVHLALDGGRDVVASIVHGEPLLERARAHARRHLADGVTTVRDLGAPGEVVADLVDRTPLRIRWAIAVTPPGGHGHFLATEAAGPQDTAAAVTAGTDRGAPWIKVFATGGVITAGSTPSDTLATEAELRAAVETATRAGARVAAHAHGTAGILAAIDAGCATVEHVSHVDDEVVRRLRDLEATCRAVSTLVATERFVRAGEIATSPPETVAKILAHAPAERASLRRLVAERVAVAAGTDAGTTHNPHGGGLAEQAALLAEAGMSTDEILRTLTLRNAETVGVSAAGITVGAPADLTAFDGDPGTDVRAFVRPQTTVVGGRIVSSGPPAATRR